MSDRLIEAKNDVIKAQALFKKCEVRKGVNPFDIDVDVYYDTMEAFNDEEVIDKIISCDKGIKWLDKAEKSIRWNIAGIGESLYQWEDGYKQATDEIDESCENLLIGNNIEKVDAQLKHHKYSFESMNFINEDKYREVFPFIYKNGQVNRYKTFSRDPKFKGINTVELAQACKLLLDIKKMKMDRCPIANVNALVQHYYLNEKKSGVDMHSGLLVRGIEKQCFTFPLTKDIPYNDPKTGEHVLTLRVEVNEKADRNGRVGSIAVLKPSKPFNYSTIDIKTLYQIYIEKMRHISKEDHFRNFYELTKSQQKLVLDDREQIIKRLQELEHYEIEVGRETCVWTTLAKTFDQQEKEAEELEGIANSAIALDKKIDIAEKYLNSFERLEHGIVDAHPRQTLFDFEVSAMEGWVEMDLNTVDYNGMPILDSMLANNLYRHIAKIDPTIVTKNFVKLIEGQKREGYDNWNWIISWLDRYQSIKDSITVDDLRYIRELIGTSFLKVFDKEAILNLIDRLNLTSIEKRAVVIDFLELDTFIQKLSTSLNSNDVRFKERILKYILSNRLHPIISDTPEYTKDIIKNFYVSLRANDIGYGLLFDTYKFELIEKEIDAEDTAWSNQTIQQKWSEIFTDARKNNEFPNRSVGLFDEVRILTGSDGITWYVTDSLHNDWAAAHISDPEEFFLDKDDVSDRWETKSNSEKIEWMKTQAGWTDEDISRDTDSYRPHNILTEVPNEFIEYNLQCWDFENNKWDKDCLLAFGLEFVSDNRIHWRIV